LARGATINIQPDTSTLTPPRSKWEREYRAFQRLLPQLLLTEYGQYVAIHEERVIDSDLDEMALITRVLARIGNIDIHVGLVTDQPAAVYRSGVVRDVYSPEVS
jgi:hypothetical protein